MATTNINGTPGRVRYQNILGVNTPLGRFDNTVVKFAAPVGEVLGIDAPLGHYDVSYNRGSVSDRAPNLPSGYTTNGMPSYGDGKLNRVTTWAADYAGTKTQDSVRYFSPLVPVKKTLTYV